MNRETCEECFRIVVEMLTAGTCSYSYADDAFRRIHRKHVERTNA